MKISGPSAYFDGRTVDRVDPDDAKRQARLDAIKQTSGSAGDVFPPGYLGDLRGDWPDDAEQSDITGDPDVFPSSQEVLDDLRDERLDSQTEAILSNRNLVADIHAGLADAEAGRVHSNDEVEAARRKRRAALAALVSDLDAIHGKPDADEVARFAEGYLISGDDGETVKQTHDDT